MRERKGTFGHQLQIRKRKWRPKRASIGSSSCRGARTASKASHTQLGTEKDGGADPMSSAEEMLRVLGFRARALAFYIIEELVSNRQVVVLGELPLHVVDDSFLR
jgi:hypothetical protein